jgi:hypothetical protein
VLGKRKITFSDSDSDDDGISGIGSIKRSKVETSGDDDWTADSDEEKVVIGRSDVIQRAFSRANAQSNGSNRSSGPMTGTDLTNNMIANNKSIVKMDSKQSNVQQQSQSNVYIVHRKDGIIKLDSSPTNKISVKGPTQSVNSGVLMLQNREGISNVSRKQIVPSNTHGNSITPVKVISKPDGTQVVTQMKVVPKGSPSKAGAVAPKNEPIKIQPKPEPNQLQQIHLVTAIPSALGLQPQRMTSSPNVRASGQRLLDGRPLLPRPATLRAAVPNSPGIMSITQTRTPVRAPPPRQVAPQAFGVQQQRPLFQKRPTSTSTLVQVSSAGALANARPKITVVNQQGKVVQKTLVNPLPKVGTPSKNQSVVSPQQKMLMARRKMAEQAGMLPKLGQRSGSGRGGVARPRGRPTEATRPKESKLIESDGLHMEFHELESESSSEEEPDFPPVPTEPAQPSEPDSPPRQFTLCPLTGRIIGPDGEPVEQQPDPEADSAISGSAPPPMAIVQVTATESSAVTDPEAAELVLPSLETLAESPGGGVVRVEMSPGGTTGTILQTSDSAAVGLQSSVVVPGPDLPCLDDPLIEVQSASEPVTTIAVIAEPDNPAPETGPESEVQVMPAAVTKEEQSAATAVTANVKMEEGGNLVTITGDDGVVYQVTGHAEDGQTLLVTRGADGEQQCVYVTTEQQGEEGSVLTLDHAVAEAVAQLMPEQVSLAPQFYVKEASEGCLDGAATVVAENQQMVMSVMDNTNTVVATGQEDGENQAQVVAQVIQADEPTPGYYYFIL